MSEEAPILEEPERSSRTLLLVGLGVVALAALIFLVIIPLLTGDDPAEDRKSVV